MKRLAFALAAASLWLARPALAADALGSWTTPTGGLVQISRCGEDLCGVIVTSPAIKANPAAKDTKNRDPGLRDRPLKGLQFLSGFSGGPTQWAGGKVYNPEDGGTYIGSIELVSDDTLKLKGCIVAPLCKTQVWKRAN